MEELQPGGPALGAVREDGELLRRHLLAVVLAEQLLDLPRPEPQVLGADLDQLAGDAPPREVEARLDPRRGQDRLGVVLVQGVDGPGNLDELASTARTLIPYGNNKPALVENRVGRGKVLVMTTPLTDPLQPRGRQCWNELWSAEDNWPAFVLWNEMLIYLVGTGEVRLNYHSGDTAVLTNDPAVYPERYQLFTPLDEPVDVLARDLPLETTSAVAAAIWYPYLALPQDRVTAWGATAYAVFAGLAEDAS